MFIENITYKIEDYIMQYDFAKEIIAELTLIITYDRMKDKKKVKNSNDFKNYLQRDKENKTNITLITRYNNYIIFFYLMSMYLFNKNAKKELLIKHKAILKSYCEKDKNNTLPHLLNAFFNSLNYDDLLNAIKNDDECVKILAFCKKHFQFYTESKLPAEYENEYISETIEQITELSMEYIQSRLKG